MDGRPPIMAIAGHAHHARVGVGTEGGERGGKGEDGEVRHMQATRAREIKPRQRYWIWGELHCSRRNSVSPYPRASQFLRPPLLHFAPPPALSVCAGLAPTQRPVLSEFGRALFLVVALLPRQCLSILTSPSPPTFPPSFLHINASRPACVKSPPFASAPASRSAQQRSGQPARRAWIRTGCPSHIDSVLGLAPCVGRGSRWQVVAAVRRATRPRK